MALLVPQRRWLAPILAAALAVPVLAMPFGPPRAVSQVENRALAPAPAAPRSAADWNRLPRAVDGYLSDHFRGRETLIVLGRAAFRRLGRAGGAADGEFALRVVDGRNGRMLLSEGLLRSTGHVYGEARVADYADFVCDAARRAPAGTKVLFAAAPSPASIYPEDAPDWALPAKARTEYDGVLERVRACGVATADLRPALRERKAQRLYRLTDSHWTERGAMIGFNVVAEALGRPDWAIDVEALDWVEVPQEDGDLPRLAGRDPVVEMVETSGRLALPPAAVRRPLEGLESIVDPPFAVDAGAAGPTVLVIGDSYTMHIFPPLLAPFAGRVAWAHAEQCRFDWNVVRTVKPDYLLILPVERNMLCLDGARPKHFD